VQPVGSDRPVMPPDEPFLPSDNPGLPNSPFAETSAPEPLGEAPRRRLSWQARMVLVGGLVLAMLPLLLIGGSALAHTLMHASGSGMCGGG
jgi:hypothetical protein